MNGPTEDSRSISRRKLLKVMVGAAGAAAVTTLPARWLKPIVDVGVLPAHAQLSGNDPRIMNLTTRPSNSFIVEFDYVDPKGEISNDTAITTWLRGPGCKTDPEPYELGNATGNWGGIPVSFPSPSQGTAQFTASLDGGCGPCDSEIQIQITVNGRMSAKTPWVKVNDSAICDE